MDLLLFREISRPLRFAAALSDWATSRRCRLVMGLSYKASTWASVSSLGESTICVAPEFSSSWPVNSATAMDSLCPCLAYSKWQRCAVVRAPSLSERVKWQDVSCNIKAGGNTRPSWKFLG